MPRGKKSAPAAPRDTWARGIMIIEAARAWREAVRLRDDRGLDLAIEALAKAVDAYERPRLAGRGGVNFGRAES